MDRRLFWLAVICGLTFVGCGEPGIKTVPVSGTVTYQGQPLEGAGVTFVPEAGTNAAAGTTDAQGKFTLKTGVTDGAPVGSYKVAISKMEATEAEIGNTKEDAAKMTAGAPMATNTSMPKSLIPSGYASPATSRLTANVTAEGPNEFTFDLQ